MCRSKIVAGNHYEPEDKGFYWRRWLERKDELKNIGHMVGRRLGQLVSEKITQVENKQLLLEKQISKYELMDRLLEKLGLSVSSLMHYGCERIFREKVEQMRAVVPPSLVPELLRCVTALEGVARDLTEIANEKKEAVEDDDKTG